MPTFKINSAVIQGIVTTVNEDGAPIHEERLPVMQIFRASHPDIWASLEAEQAKLAEAAVIQSIT